MLNEKQFVVRGFGSGAIAGLLAFVFARIFTEPQIQQAIDYESGRDAAQAALDRAAGIAVAADHGEIYSRGVQANIGAGIGLVVFGLALGGIFSVVYVLCARRWPATRPRRLAVIVAGGLFAVLYAVPFLKYPANPPAVGHEETIGARTALYAGMMAVSAVALVGAAALYQRLATRLGSWNATLTAAALFIAVVGVGMLLFPALGELHANAAYGHHATETPVPLLDGDGHVVFPGFPADVLFQFRLYSFLGQAILWGSIGLVFGALCERLHARAASPLGVPAGLRAELT
jgi:hypothetical protein